MYHVAWDAISNIDYISDSDEEIESKLVSGIKEDMINGLIVYILQQDVDVELYDAKTVAEDIPILGITLTLQNWLTSLGQLWLSTRISSTPLLNSYSYFIKG